MLPIQSGYNRPQSTHRAATASFWRTFHHNGKLSPAWWGWGGGVHADPLSLYLPSHTIVWCTLPLRGHADTLPLFLLHPYMNSVGIQQPAADCNGCLAHFFYIWICWIRYGSLLQTHPARSPSRIAWRGQEGPKGSKGPFGLISRPITDLCFFLSQCHAQDTGRRL